MQGATRCPTITVITIIIVVVIMKGNNISSNYNNSNHNRNSKANNEYPSLTSLHDKLCNAQLHQKLRVKPETEVRGVWDPIR